MKKEKQPRTRKEKALRRLAVLVVLAVFCLTTGVVRVLPTQAIVLAEETFHTGPTEVVKALGPIPMKGERLTRIYLSANEGGILISLSKLYVLGGWSDYGGNSLDCSGGASIHAATYSISRGEDETVAYIYGRVDEPLGETVRVILRYEDETGWVEAGTLEIPREQWLERNGRWYFAEQLPRSDDGERAPWTWAVLLDGAGESLTEEERVFGGGTGLFR